MPGGNRHAACLRRESKGQSPVPVAALAWRLLVAIVVAPSVSVAVIFGLAGIDPLATV